MNLRIWKNQNLPTWIKSAVIHEHPDRANLSVSTIHGSAFVCFDNLKKAKRFFSREYATAGFRANWKEA